MADIWDKSEVAYAIQCNDGAFPSGPLCQEISRLHAERDALSRRVEEMTKALEDAKADNVKVQEYVEDGHEAPALAQLRSGFSKLCKALANPQGQEKKAEGRKV